MERDRAYARYAFLNPYNLVTFAGVTAFGLLTGHHWVVVLGAAAEVMWLIFAPDSKFLRSVWFDPAFDRAEQTYLVETRQARNKRLLPQDAMRIKQLEQQKQEIERVARENPSLAVDLLANELVRLDGLLDDFSTLALSAERAEAHAQSFDFSAMRRSWHIHEQHARALDARDPRRQVAEKNMAVLRQRRERYDDLSRTIQVTRGQMELIENTFRLLADEILTMASPHELGGRIDELRVAVDAVRETADETLIPWEAIEAEDDVQHV